MNIFFEIIGYLAGIFVAFAFMPQTLKTFKTKDVSGFSLVTYSIYTLGILFWVIYGYYIHSVQMVVFNFISLCFALLILYMILKYGK